MIFFDFSSFFFFDFCSGFLTSIGCVTFLIDDNLQEFELMHQCQINSFCGVLHTALSSQPKHFEAYALNQRRELLRFFCRKQCACNTHAGYVHHFYQASAEWTRRFGVLMISNAVKLLILHADLLPVVPN
jgi:hypothetical protein